MSIRARLTRTVVGVVVLAIVVFGGISFFVVDRTLRSSFHAQLDTLVRSVAGAADIHDGRLNLDAHDMLQISLVHAGTPFALFDRAHHRVVGDLLLPPAERAGLAVATAPVRRNGIVYGWAAAWEPEGWIGAFDRWVIGATIAIGFVLAAVGIALSRRTVGAVLAPLDEIASLAERIEAHDLSSRLRSTDDGEVGRICASFNRMLDRLEHAFARESRFVADVSHELRTPLAVITAEAELALRRARDGQEYREALASIRREAERLAELTGELLEVARSQVDAQDVQRLDLSRIVTDVAKRVHPAAEVHGVTVLLDANGAEAARANAATVERALLAVVHNAIQHAGNAGTVLLRVFSTGSVVSIAVADSGHGFSDEALAHATERFWRGDAARARGGTGLGLAIARAMIESGGGSITLSNRSEGGALVTISLPRGDA